MTLPSRSSTCYLLDLAVPFVAVGLGALTGDVALRAEGPDPPSTYWPGLFIVLALAGLASLFALPFEDAWNDDDPVDHRMRLKVAGLAYLLTVLASVEVILLSRFLK